MNLTEPYGWISVNNALPEDEDEDVVVADFDLRWPNFSIGSYSREYNKWYVHSVSYELERPTHWCRLPMPPTDG